MDLDSISPYIRVAFPSSINAPWHLKERVIFDYEILLIKEAELLITIEDKSYHGMPGDIFLFKPRQRHSMRIIKGTRFIQPHIHFDLFYHENRHDVKVSFNPL